MAITYKFSTTTKTTKEEAIQEVLTANPVALPEVVEPVTEEQQITLTNYKAFVERLLPIVRRAKKSKGLIAEVLKDERLPDGGPLVRFTVATVASIAKEEGVDKTEIQKIWDMA